MASKLSKLNCFGCKTLKHEIYESKWFSLDQANGEYIDVEQSFSRRDYGFIILFLRLFFFSWSASAFTSHFIRFPIENKFYFMSYFSHWSWFVALLYQMSVIIITVFRSFFLKQPPEGDSPYIFIRITWFLYAVAAPSTMLLNILLYAPSLPMDVFHQSLSAYLNVVEHTMVFLMVLIDGAILARIPMKLKHFAFLFTFLFSYLIWTLVHDFANIGNVTWPDEISFQGTNTNTTSIDTTENATDIFNSTDISNSTYLNQTAVTSPIIFINTTDIYVEDFLYPFLSWKEKPGSTVLIFFLALFVVSPIFFFVLWIISLKPRRIYGGPLGGI